MARLVADLLCVLISCTKVIAIFVLFGLCMWISKNILGWPNSLSFELMVDDWNIDLWVGLAMFFGLIVFEPTKIVMEDVLKLLTDWQERLKLWSRPPKGRLGRR
ncbi:MAG: hypothetical protein RIC29_00135 [Rhodospirillaceae bacterium]